MYLCVADINLIINKLNNINNFLSFEAFRMAVLTGPLPVRKITCQMEHNVFKNPTGGRLTGWLFYKHGWGFEYRTTVNQVQAVTEERLKPAFSGLHVQHPYPTRPRCLPPSHDHDAPLHHTGSLQINCDGRDRGFWPSDLKSNILTTTPTWPTQLIEVTL